MFSEARMSELIKIKDDYDSKSDCCTCSTWETMMMGWDTVAAQCTCLLCSHSYFGKPLALSPERVEEGKENESK